ncbi:uracil phosphoribosyltransferase-domain-containing protein [Xylariaceae sp. FL1651]|nr:uracil phosphoribosyltransferase-domain-containing protein [Xylariaceae sp. FL1651]
MLSQQGSQRMGQPTAWSSANDKPVVIGIYGVPASGKTYLVKQLERELERDHYEFFDGSQVIASVVPGGLSAFQKLGEQDKAHWRERAIASIRERCARSKRTAIVAGHFMVWSEEDTALQPVCTAEDLATYTHIFYLDTAEDIIAQRRLDDTKRQRPYMSPDKLINWKNTEKRQLQQLCLEHNILFYIMSQQGILKGKLSMLIRDFRSHSEAYNLSLVESKLDEIIGPSNELQTMLVLDADRTLTGYDTGELFWKSTLNSKLGTGIDRLKELFGSHLGYSYTAFRQAALLYEEIADEQEIDNICTDVASAVTVHPEFISLLQLVSKQAHMGTIVVTCGLRCIWDKILEKEGLSTSVKIIGGGRIADGFVITAAMKASIVTRLRDTHGLYVWAFGDSPLDLPMLKKANQAIVVVGQDSSRSKSMDARLLNAIEHDGLQASQVMLPSHASARLNVAQLPLLRLNDSEFVQSITSRRSRRGSDRIFHATSRPVAKLLMTPTRDATIRGPRLREAHRRIGWFLAVEFLADIVGLEDYLVLHVQGHHTAGFQVRNEKQTLIIAIMRGGEPMALGVSDALPAAMFIHAKEPDEIKSQHLHGHSTILLVDSVVNSGKSVTEFVQHIRRIHATVRIVVVAGVIQSRSIFDDGGLIHRLLEDANFSVVALRLSSNQFIGEGGTDTGNRLFNTTHIL